MIKSCTNKECKQINPQPLEQFQKDCKSKDGYCNKCKSCKKEYRQSPEVRAYDLAYNKMYAKREAEKVKARTRRNNIRKLYGMTQEETVKLSASQNDCCAICYIHVSKTKYPHLCIDHNHGTGKVRGMLCDTCNRAIGLLKDSPEVLENAAKYLRSRS